ncbi:MAG: glycosyltransferase family 2 protein [Planctomycetota bacterium]|jgi:glycosyltransferase involved in cell wall biosynthesis
MSIRNGNATKLSIVVPCFNEEKTLRKCIEKVLEIDDDTLFLELIIVDDCSSDRSLVIARELEDKYPGIINVLNHKINQGKGAALRTGFQKATGDFVAVQDADLEYNPMEFKKLLVPLINNQADVVFGSRFLSAGHHRVLYFWHYLGNRLLTFLSNMFTDLNLTDMETCYKVFKREIIQNIQIKENRFGFEPEIVAKVAQMRLRIFEIGISYYARTYEEGKKIGIKDGIRALYCIFRYNAHFAPLPIQFLIYFFIGVL